MRREERGETGEARGGRVTWRSAGRMKDERGRMTPAAREVHHPSPNGGLRKVIKYSGSVVSAAPRATGGQIPE